MRILIATDGSEVSDTAVECAAQEASDRDAALEIVHVLTPETELVDGSLVLPGEEQAVEYGERTLRQARELAAETAATEIEITTELLAGRPAAAIADYATETSADRIYVGHRGLSERQEQVVGSVAKTVVDKSTVPVTVVK
ncbi:universal stress protein [Natronococcus occultus]|uniref:Universal stress protein UspA-like protein n=1 Tax=Natronococcus occultus SP4 TaxID=694430 RepID=L0K0V8_9EURY|nr:universal stress protein [Natronococcus occultus]AGB38922.1 universal stress protein UspA-like protein [Natronococcus occultus SP4]